MNTDFEAREVRWQTPESNQTTSPLQQDMDGQTGKSKAEQCSDDSWASSYARYYRAQHYASDTPSRHSGVRTVLVVLTVLLVLGVLSALGITMLQDHIWTAVRNGLEGSGVEHETVISPTVNEPLEAGELKEALCTAGAVITAQVTRNGEMDYNTGGIPLFNRSSCSMSYSGSATAAIDFSAALLEVTESRVLITIPSPELQEIVIDPTSIAYSNEVKPLFGGDVQHDTEAELEAAAADFADKLCDTDLYAQLQAEAEELVIVRLESVIGSRHLIIRHA